LPHKFPEDLKAYRKRYKLRWLQTPAGQVYKRRERLVLNKRRAATAEVIRILKQCLKELEA
jgi:hypothetical protein